jgi:hypothetical protein
VVAGLPVGFGGSTWLLSFSPATTVFIFIVTVAYAAATVLFILVHMYLFKEVGRKKNARGINYLVYYFCSSAFHCVP